MYAHAECQHRSRRYFRCPREFFLRDVAFMVFCENPHCRAVGFQVTGSNDTKWYNHTGKSVLGIERVPQKVMSRGSTEMDDIRTGRPRRSREARTDPPHHPTTPEGLRRSQEIK